MPCLESVLRTSGFTMTMRLDKGDPADRNWVDAHVVLRGAAHLQGILHAETSTWISRDDIESLASYLSQAIREPRSMELDSEDRGAFVPLNLGFELRAFDVEFLNQTDGDLTLLVFLNVGVGPGGRRIYFGAKGVAEFSEVDAFATSLTRLAAQLEVA